MIFEENRPGENPVYTIEDVEKSMRIVCISDTHNAQPMLPDGDILMHAGDALGVGSEDEWYQFLRWLTTQKQYKHIFYTPGNHDHAPFKMIQLRKDECNQAGVVMLVDELWEGDGLHVYGTPWVPYINGHWAFEAPDPNLDESDFLYRKFQGIGQLEACNGELQKKIVLSHAPPKGILDEGAWHFGSQELLDMVMVVKPDLHVFGHIHEAYGMRDLYGVKFVNAAIMTLQYKPDNAPVVVDL